MYRDIKALILRETRYKEADRIITIYSDETGRISLRAPGAVGKKSRIAAATQQQTYSCLTVSENNGRTYVKEATVIEPFEGLRTDMLKLSLGAYFCECLESVSVENTPEPGLLSLILNSLYALSHELYPTASIKAAYELRLMSLTGYRPNLDTCAVCGREPTEPVLSHTEGNLICRGCIDRTSASQRDTVLSPLSGDILKAMRYIISANPKRLFAFTLDELSRNSMGVVTEKYLLLHTSRKFETLSYWKNLNRYI